MRLRLLLLVSAVLSVVPLSCQTSNVSSTGTQKSGAVAAGPAPRVLETFPVDQVKYALTIGPCINRVCPNHVALLEGGQMIDKLALPVASVSQEANEEPVDPAWGADTHLRAWASGEEDEYVGTAAQLLRLTPQQAGLLVDQHDGFQVIKRQHVLVLEQNRKLQKVWEFLEGEGPTWSATRVVPSEIAGGQDVALYAGFKDPNPAKLERLQLERIHWDAVARQVNRAPLPDPTQPVYVLQLGIYATAAAARRARAAHGECTNSLWVIGTVPYPVLPVGKVLLGMVYLNSAEAEAAAAEMGKCSPALKPSVLKSGGRK